MTITITCTNKSKPLKSKTLPSDWSSILICDLHYFLSSAMSSLIWSCTISYLITFPSYFSGLPLSLPLGILPMTNLSHLFTGTSMHLLSICPNYRSLTSLILSSTTTTLSFSRITSFFILSFLVLPTNPSQQPHLRNIHHLNMWVLNWPTRHPIKQGRSNHHFVELTF